MFKTKQFGMGAYLLLASDLCAVLALIGCIWMGDATTAVVCIVLGIAASFLALYKSYDILLYPSYLLYIAAFGCAVYAKLYTISNILTAIDATSFPASLVYTGVMLVLTLITGFAATLFSVQKKN